MHTHGIGSNPVISTPISTMNYFTFQRLELKGYNLDKYDFLDTFPLTNITINNYSHCAIINQYSIKNVEDPKVSNRLINHLVLEQISLQSLKNVLIKKHFFDTFFVITLRRYKTALLLDNLLNSSLLPNVTYPGTSFNPCDLRIIFRPNSREHLVLSKAVRLFDSLNNNK